MTISLKATRMSWLRIALISPVLPGILPDPRNPWLGLPAARLAGSREENESGRDRHADGQEPLRNSRDDV
jgi:hypothetical protein